jgi:hypothetical protein
LRRLGPAGLAIGIFFTVWATPVNAAGPLYAVPDHPPSDSESVGFTNALNHRVRHLPAALNPPTAQSPAEVEARLQALDRGVVIERGAVNERKAKQPAVSSAPRQETTAVSVADEPDDRAPLSVAFVGAGALALLGLMLSARGKHPRSTQEA